MEKKRKDVTSCGCLVIRVSEGEPEVLLVKPFRDREAWGVPKGHMDEGETHEETALREVKEETGLIVRLGPELARCKTKNHHENKTVITFLAFPTDARAELVGDGENDEMRWFSLDKLPEIHKYQQDMIAGGVDFIKRKLSLTPENLGLDFFLNVLNSDGDT